MIKWKIMLEKFWNGRLKNKQCKNTSYQTCSEHQYLQLSPTNLVPVWHKNSKKSGVILAKSATLASSYLAKNTSKIIPGVSLAVGTYCAYERFKEG